MTPEKVAVARKMYESGEHTVAAIAAVLAVSRASIYRHLGAEPLSDAAAWTQRACTAGGPPLAG